jgi:hypothetical protein
VETISPSRIDTAIGVANIRATRLGRKLYVWHNDERAFVQITASVPPAGAVLHHIAEPEQRLDDIIKHSK